MKFTAAIFLGILVLAFAAVSWQRAGLYNDVETLYRTNLAYDPNSQHSYGCLGLLLMEQGRLEEAVEEFKKAVATTPPRRFARLNLATAYHKLGRFSEAAQEFRISLAANPNDPDAHNNYGATLFQMGRTDDAIREYLAALQLTGHCTDAWINLLDALTAQGRQADVAKVLSSAQQYAAEHSRRQLTTRLDKWKAEHQ